MSIHMRTRALKPSSMKSHGDGAGRWTSPATRCRRWRASAASCDSNASALLTTASAASPGSPPCRLVALWTASSLPHRLAPFARDPYPKASVTLTSKQKQPAINLVFVPSQYYRIMGRHALAEAWRRAMDAHCSISTPGATASRRCRRSRSSPAAPACRTCCCKVLRCRRITETLGCMRMPTHFHKQSSALKVRAPCCQCRESKLIALYARQSAVHGTNLPARGGGCAAARPDPGRSRAGGRSDGGRSDGGRDAHRQRGRQRAAAPGSDAAAGLQPSALRPDSSS